MCLARSPRSTEKGTEKIRTQASHLLSLINSILEITKIETGGTSLNLEPIDLNALSSELESDYAMVSKEKNLAVNWHMPANLPRITCDRIKLRQVIINLVNNAIKFTDEGSVDIFFRSVADEPFFEVSVADAGIGMADEFLPHIFDKFRQIDNSTTRNLLRHRAWALPGQGLPRPTGRDDRRKEQGR